MGTAVKGWNFVGLDLGQTRDFTAMAIVERAELTGEWDAAKFAFEKRVELRLRYLKRLPLGTPYPEAVAWVRTVTRAEELAGRCHLVVDATGVGRPVLDPMRQAGLGCRLMPVTITGGETEHGSGEHYRVPKRNLVRGLQVLLQCGALHVSRGLPYGEELKKEMREMQEKVTAAGNTQYGAWGTGAHDDLVMAVMLACWGVRKVYPNGWDAGHWRREGQGDWEREVRKWGEQGVRLL